MFAVHLLLVASLEAKKQFLEPLHEHFSICCFLIGVDSEHNCQPTDDDVFVWRSASSCRET